MTPTDGQINAAVTSLYALSTGMSQVVAGKPAVTRLAVLQVVAHSGAIRPSEIASALNLHQSQVTRQIQALEEDGLVRVSANPDDRRSWVVTLTEAGKAEIGRLTEVGMTKWRRFFAGWETDEVTELARLLAKLQSSIQETKTDARRSRA